ncbi:MAG: bifunctional enoyl-CoA hydratase/phosphate acetyltransferase [Erysipelotrichaceae bacterium]
MQNLYELLKSKIDGKAKVTMAIAVAEDYDVLSSVNQAKQASLINPILIGDEDKIRSLIKEHHFDLDDCVILHEMDKTLACEKAVKLVSSNQAHALMKGLVDTSILLKAVLNKEWGLRKHPILSHVTVVQIEGFERLFYITDAGMNIAPVLQTKVHIIENCVPVAKLLGLKLPKVGVICAVEKVNPKMQATLDALALSDMQKQGLIKDCEVDGPFGLDNAVSEIAAHHKGITTPNAGLIDILLMPEIEAGNILYKSIAYFSHSTSASVIVGASAPIVLTSRADSDQTKLNSIALAVLLGQVNL